jgi:hypothetical protein
MLEKDLMAAILVIAIAPRDSRGEIIGKVCKGMKWIAEVKCATRRSTKNIAGKRKRNFQKRARWPFA